MTITWRGRKRNLRVRVRKWTVKQGEGGEATAGVSEEGGTQIGICEGAEWQPRVKVRGADKIDLS